MRNLERLGRRERKTTNTSTGTLQETTPRHQKGMLGLFCFDHAVEGDSLYVCVGRSELHGDPLFQIVLELFEVGLVPRGEHQRIHARTPRGDGLLLDSADGKHLARQTHLSSHRNVRPARNARGEAQQGGDHRHSRGRPVLRRGALGHVHVDICLVKKVCYQWIDFPLAAVPGRRGLQDLPRDGDGDLATFLHHGAQLAGGHESAAARTRPSRTVFRCIPFLVLDGRRGLPHRAGLNVEAGSTHGCPRQTHDHPWWQHIPFVQPIGDEDRLADVVRQVLHRHLVRHRLPLLVGDAFDHLERQLARDLLDLLLQVAHAGLPAVPPDELFDRLVRNAHFRNVDRLLLCLLRDGFLAVIGLSRTGRSGVCRTGRTLGDLHLLRQVVAGDANHFHAVQERSGDRVQRVRRADEENLGEIKGNVEVVIGERVVLRGVEQLEQGRRRVSLVASPELVHLVDHHDGVGHARLLQALDELAGHRSHVGAAVALDGRHVAQASDAEAIELAPQGRGDGLADGRLANSRRPHEAQDLALHGAPQLPDGDELPDAALHVLEAVVVSVQDVLRGRHVEAVGGVQAIRHRRKPVEVVARQIELRRSLLQAFELGDLLVDHVHGLLGHLPALVLGELSQALPKVLHQDVLVVPLQPELLLDLLVLLHEEVLPLPLGNALLHLPADLVLDAAELPLPHEQVQGEAQARGRVPLLQHLLQLLAVGGGERRGEVRQLEGVVHVDALREDADLLQRLAEQGVDAHHLAEGGDNLVAVGPDVHIVAVVVKARPVVHLYSGRWARLQHALEVHSSMAHEEHLVRLSIGTGGDALDLRERPDVVHLVYGAEELWGVSLWRGELRLLEEQGHIVVAVGLRLQERFHSARIREVEGLKRRGKQRSAHGGDADHVIDARRVVSSAHIRNRAGWNSFGGLLRGVRALVCAFLAVAAVAVVAAEPEAPRHQRHACGALLATHSRKVARKAAAQPHCAYARSRGSCSAERQIRRRFFRLRRSRLSPPSAWPSCDGYSLHRPRVAMISRGSHHRS
eukprot:scaffold2979_cov243-Pinguiococcus_pyrenoidosus.AAC.17